MQALSGEGSHGHTQSARSQAVPPACWPLQPAPTSCRYDIAPFCKYIYCDFRYIIEYTTSYMDKVYCVTLLWRRWVPQLEGTVFVKVHVELAADMLHTQAPQIVVVICLSWIEGQLLGDVGGKWKLLDSIADQLPPLVSQLVWWPRVKAFEHDKGLLLRFHAFFLRFFLFLLFLLFLLLHLFLSFHFSFFFCHILWLLLLCRLVAFAHWQFCEEIF